MVRTAKKEDAERLLEIYDYYVRNTAVSFEYETPSLDEFMSRMEHTLTKYPYLVIVRDGRIEGYAYAGPFKGRPAYGWSCEISIYLDRSVLKCGLAYKFGRWYNMIWMEKNIGEHVEHPDPVRRYQSQH